MKKILIYTSFALFLLWADTATAALQSLTGNGYYLVPDTMSTGRSFTPGYSTALFLTSTTSKVAFIFQAPVSCTVSHIEWSIGTVTTGAQVDVRLETMNKDTGFPTGNLLGTTSDADTNASTSNVWEVSQLFAQTAITKGQFLAVVIQASSSVANISVGIRQLATTQGFSSIPFPFTFASSTWTTANSTDPIIALRCNDGSYPAIAGAFPASTLGQTVFSTSSSTADRVGLKFKLPVPAMMAGVTVLTNAASSSIFLYDSDGSTILASLSVQNAGPAAGGNRYFIFPSAVSLSANTFYRVVVVASSSVSVNLGDFNVASATILNAISGGTNFFLTQATSSLSWYDATSSRPYMQLLLTQFDDGAGGGRVIIRRAKVSFLEERWNELAGAFYYPMRFVGEIIAGFTNRVFAFIR